MPEPTQEQIEAAATAIASHPDFDGAPIDYLSVAEAALKAAAGVGWPSEQLVHDLVHSATEEDKATIQRPAAGVWEKNWKPDIHGTKAECWDTAVSITIERCAQVAEDMLKREPQDLCIPDAIRALKDKH